MPGVEDPSSEAWNRNLDRGTKQIKKSLDHALMHIDTGLAGPGVVDHRHLFGGGLELPPHTVFGLDVARSPGPHHQWDF